MTRITAKLEHGMAVQLSNGRHQWQADEHIQGDFDEAQHKRLAQIARRCPVHKTLAHGVAFEDNATFAKRSDS